MMMRLLLVLALFPTASSFAPLHNVKTTTTQLAVVQHEDHLVPDRVRSKRSKKIRDKLLGDMESRFEPEGDCPLLAHQKFVDAEEANKKKRYSKKMDDGHPLLNQMLKLFDQHVLETERVDPNA